MPLNAARSVIIRFKMAQHIVEPDAAVPETEVLLQLVQDPPGIHRQPVPDGARDAAEVGQRVAQGGRRILPEHERQQVLLEGANRHRFTEPLRQQLQPDQHTEQRQQLGGVLRPVRVRQTGHGAAQQPHRVLRTLRVAPEPEQIVGDPAGQIGRPSLVPDHHAGLRQQRHRADGTVRQHPRVLAAPAALHRHHRHVAHARHAGEPARHHDKGIAVSGDVGPEDQRPRLQAMAEPDRRGRQCHLILADELMGARTHLRDQRGFLALGQLPTEQRLPVLRRKCPLGDQLVEMFEDVLQLLRLAAPPGGDRRKHQLLAEQVPAQTRQERHDGGRLDHARAEGVGNRHVAGPRGLDQSGHAERRIAAQLERIAEAVVEAAKDDVDGLEAVEGLDEDATVAHRQIAALDQREAEIPREIGVLEVGFVVRARRQQHDLRLVALLWRQRSSSASR